MKRFFGFMAALVLFVGLLPLSARAEGPQVQAKSAVLMELSTGKILSAQNEHTPLPPASVTKVMTMLLIMEAIDSGKISWEDTVTASETAAAKGGSQVYLKVGETMSVRDMVKAIAVSSANDCACAMAEHLAGSEEAFVTQMNDRAKALGMADTHFINCTGLDDGPDGKNHLTSAYDIALMSRELLVNHPAIKEFTTIWMDTLREGTFGLSNTNKMVRFYSGCTGLKTGFTQGAGYCLSASAQREGMELVAVVMGCESSRVRFDACKSLLDYGFANFAVISPEIPDARVPVTLGKSENIRAVPGEVTPLLIDKGQKNSVTTDITLEESVSAPVAKGQRLGTLTMKAGEQILAQVPLVAEESVEALSFWNIFGKLLRKVCLG